MNYKINIHKILFILVLGNKISYVQYNEIIRSGRLGKAIGVFTVGKSMIQFQPGVDYFTVNHPKYKNTGYLSNNVIRFGVLENVEIIALLDYQSEKYKYGSFSKSLSGLSNLHFGIRFHINDQKGWIPTTRFQIRLKVPETLNNYGHKNLAPIMVFVANWSLPRKFSFATNWELSYNESDSDPTGKYVFNLGYQVSDKWSCFIENYGQYYLKDFKTRFDGGFAYLINKNTQLDLSAGFGNNKALKDYFVSAGISWGIASIS